jgi:hypothetical protein
VQQQATDSLPQDTSTSILDMPEQTPQVNWQQPTYAPGEGSNPADYHPTNVAPPGVGSPQPAAQPTGIPAGAPTDSAVASPDGSAAPDQVGEANSAPPPLPSTVDGLQNQPTTSTPAPGGPLSKEDLVRPLDPNLGGPQPAAPAATVQQPAATGQQPTPTVQQPAATAPADSSQGLY